MISEIELSFPFQFLNFCTMWKPAIISFWTYMDTPLRAIRCSNFNPERDFQVLRVVFNSKEAVEKLIALGDIQSIWYGQDIEEILAATKAVESTVAEPSESLEDLIKKVRGTTTDLLYHYASGFFPDGGWVSFIPSNIKWFDNDKRTVAPTPKNNYSLAA